MKRSSGVLMPIFSLPNKYGIGDFGKSGYDFVDFLRRSGQSVWQILPLVQTGYGNSPYSSISSESFSPYYISPEVLRKKKLITDEELKFSVGGGETIDYGELYAVRFPLLKKAFSRFDTSNSDFQKYLKSRVSYDYALYMTLKYASGQKHFYEWSDEFKYRDKKSLSKLAKDYEDEVTFWQFIQYEALSEWLALKKYANDNGIKIIGDMPLYVALDSVDVWVHPRLFKLNEDFSPKKVAGVPPDYFCADGQLWGNPVYDYDNHRADGFKWWTERIKKALRIYDYVRIDHFRGLDRYYEIPSDAHNARNGEWVDVPSDELFEAVHKKVGADKIIAEDLGIIDDGVRELLKKTGYPGMKILSFAFNGQSDNHYLPENIEENSVCYTGTHDNDTLKGLIGGASEWDYNNFHKGVQNSLKVFGLNDKTDTVDDLIDAVVKLGMRSAAKLFILPMQDLLHSGAEYRINEPGTVSTRNWAVRIQKNCFSATVANKLKRLTVEAKR